MAKKIYNNPIKITSSPDRVKKFIKGCEDLLEIEPEIKYRKILKTELNRLYAIRKAQKKQKDQPKKKSKKGL